jgi:hypothetical protein
MFKPKHVGFSERAVAHAARGAQCRDDRGDDAADDLEDGLPRFLFLCISCVTIDYFAMLRGFNIKIEQKGHFFVRADNA